MNALISQLLGYLIDFTKYAQKFAGGVGLPKLNYSWLIILFFVFVVFLVGLSLGKSRILLSLISLYVAAFLEPHFIYFDKLREVVFQKAQGKPEFWLHIGLFLIFFIISLLILNRSVLKHSLALRETSFFPIILTAILEIGFLTSLLMAYLPPEISKNLPAGAVKFFDTKNARFWWALAPLVLLLFMKRKKESPKISP